VAQRIISVVAASVMAAASVCASTIARGERTPGPAETKAATAADPQQPEDPCVSVAGAKFAQWGQKRLMIQQTKTFADGTKKDIEIIFTENAVYGHDVGKPWLTMNTPRAQRAAPPPDRLVKQMGLAECQRVGPAKDFAEPASFYTYTYVPDSNASHVSGQIWIADLSGLPVQQTLRQEEETSHSHVPVEISARYTYGDDVKVPNDAQSADDFRRWLAQQNLNMPMTGGHGGGNGQASGGGRR
jgi:hypothetical protein